MIVEFEAKRPRIHPAAFSAPTAALIGDIEIGEGAGVWYGAFMRADFGPIVVGPRVHIEDNCVLHGAVDCELFIEPEVIVGHAAMLENCRIGRGAVIGARAVVFGAEVGEQAMIAAGSVVTGGMIIPARVLAAGVPAQVRKEISGESLWFIEKGTAMYNDMIRPYRHGARILPEGGPGEKGQP